MEDAWPSQKMQTILDALADIAAYINGLSHYRDVDDDGIPTGEARLAGALHLAVHTATEILAEALEVEWQAIDANCIIRYGQVGLDQLLVRYGLATPKPNLPPRDAERDPPTPLELLDAMRPTWTFEAFDVTRPLQGAVTWDDVIIDEERQRALLAQAFVATYRYAEQPEGWLLIAGPVGAGKSHLAGAIIRHTRAHGIAPLYLSALTITRRYRSPNDPDWPAEQLRLEAVELLVLDDLFLDQGMVWNGKLEQMLRARLRDHRPTVLVSTRSREHLPVWLSNAVAEISMIASSYRRLHKRA
jgi:hypothetical protein